MTIDLGAGFAPVGFSPFGYGLPGSTTSISDGIYITPAGTQGNVAAINPQTGDYILNENNNLVGDFSVPQGVYLTLTTKLNSSALAGFGIDLGSLRTITSNLVTQIQSLVQIALAPMINQSLIALQSVKVTQQNNPPGSIIIIVNWQDLSSGELNQTKLLG